MFAFSCSVMGGDFISAIISNSSGDEATKESCRLKKYIYKYIYKTKM